jgi:signal transduction histidine kinase
MGNHGVASASLRAGDTSGRIKKSTVVNLPSSRPPALQNWPVLWRLIAVIVLALIMGLVFGGLRVASAAGSAAEFGRVSQLANLGQQVTVLVQALEDERDETTGVISGGSPDTLKPPYHATDVAAARVRTLAASVGGSFPANIQASVATVLSVINDLGELRKTAYASQDPLAVIANYAAPISDMITLNDQIAQGTSDASLANDVRALNSLSLAKDEAAQQRALFFNTFTQQFFGDGVQQALTTALSEELIDKASFETTATLAEQNSFNTTVAGQGVNLAEGIEDFILTDGNPADISQLGINLNQAPAKWYSAMSDKIDKMQAVELGVARNIVARAQALKRGAEQSALFTAILTTVILLLVLIGTLAVARSLLLPLRRLRAGALDIATVQLPERVRQLAEAEDPARSLEVAPIDVLSTDEIGQVARAFDQVHSEAVRLAGNEALLRRSFNAMFVNLSRRSQSLIERLARMIDSLEQNEEDPDRLSNLFSMDHLVTRMRRNSENLLLLAGHESARKWSEPVLLADVARAATSEIEQYARVTLSVQPGIAVAGMAVSDVARLLAEIIENATVFSPRDTQVRVSAQELASGGVLIQVSDSGVGVSEARLAEMNQRLDNPPVIDESVSRHMGLFAVGRLAERHGVRVRLRAGSPQGLTALVWLPDSLAERGSRPYGVWSQPLAPQAVTQFATQAVTPQAVTTKAVTREAVTREADFQARRTPGRHSITMRPDTDGQSANDRADAVVMSTDPDAVAMSTRIVGDRHETAQAADSATSNWFRSRRPAAAGTAGNGGVPLAANGTAGNGGGPPEAALQASLPQAGDAKPSGSDVWADGRQAAQIIADPVRSDRTVAGMPVRVPRANLLPGSAGGGRHADSRVNSRPADGHEAQTPTALQRRSPETARSRLSGFQRGTRRAEGQTPRTGEGADR